MENQYHKANGVLAGSPLRVETSNPRPSCVPPLPKGRFHITAHKGGEYLGEATIVAESQLPNREAQDMEIKSRDPRQTLVLPDRVLWRPCLKNRHPV